MSVLDDKVIDQINASIIKQIIPKLKTGLSERFKTDISEDEIREMLGTTFAVKAPRKAASTAKPKCTSTETKGGKRCMQVGTTHDVNGNLICAKHAIAKSTIKTPTPVGSKVTPPTIWNAYSNIPAKTPDFSDVNESSSAPSHIDSKYEIDLVRREDGYFLEESTRLVFMEVGNGKYIAVARLEHGDDEYSQLTSSDTFSLKTRSIETTVIPGLVKKGVPQSFGIDMMTNSRGINLGFAPKMKPTSSPKFATPESVSGFDQTSSGLKLESYRPDAPRPPATLDD